MYTYFWRTLYDLHEVTNCQFAFYSHQPRYHVAKELADDLIKQYGGEEISVLQFVSKVDTQQNDMSVMFRVSCLAAQCDMVPLSVKWSCAM